MSTVANSRCVPWFLVIVFAAGCSGKTPEQIEAEKRQADEAWLAQVARAESARQREEERLVRAQVAEHQRVAQADDERAARNEENARQETRERLLDVLRARLVNADAARFANLRLNSARDALCGEVTEQGADGSPGEPHRFVVGAAGAAIDRDQERERFTELAAGIDCMQ